MAITLLLFISTLPSSSGAGEVISYLPNETMRITVVCKDTSSALCSSSTACSLNIFYPNWTTFLQDQELTYNSTHFYYDTNSSWYTGVYHAVANCTDGTVYGVTDWDFYVGSPSTEVQEATTSRGIYILFGIAVLFFIAFLTIKQPTYKWSFFMFSLLFLVAALNIASISLRNEASSQNIINIFDTIGAISYYMIWFFGGLIIIIWILTFIASLADKKKMREYERIGQPWQPPGGFK